MFAFSVSYTVQSNAKPVDSHGCESDYAECAPIGKWEFGLGIGAGIRTNPLRAGDDLPIVLLPSISYYGERFFLENLRAGFTLFDTRRSHMMNVVVTVGLEQIYFEDVGVGNFFLDGQPPTIREPIPEEELGAVIPSSSLNGTRAVEDLGINLDDIERRKTAGLAGLEYQYNIHNFAFNFQALSDVTKIHSGSEGRLSISYPFSAGKNDFGIALGGIWQSDKLLNYYYGVSAEDINAQEALYVIDSGGVSPFLHFSWRRELTKRWSLNTIIQGKALTNDIKNSPLVEKDAVFNVFFGGVYRF